MNSLSSKSFLGILLVFLALFAFSSCQLTSSDPVVRQDHIYDTLITLTVFDPKSEDVFGKIFDRLHEIDEKMSMQKSGSEINKVSAAAGISAIPVSEDTFTVLKNALTVSQMTGGVFDPTIGPVTSLWNITADNPRVPDKKDLEKALKLVDWKKIALDDANRSIFLKDRGMKLDFGGIAKGFASDEAARIARENGVKSAILSMGDSTIYLLGKKPNGSKWRVGVQNPDPGAQRGTMIGVIETEDSVVETSGPYERFFVQDGKRYHHIMNPKTGYPAESGLAQVTIILPADTKLGDGLSTSCFIMGLKEGMKFLESLPDAAGIFVTDDHQVFLSSRVGSTFTLTDKNFKPGYTGDS